MAEGILQGPVQIEDQPEAHEVPYAITGVNYQFFLNGELSPLVRARLPRELDATYRILNGEDIKGPDDETFGFQFGYGSEEQLVVGVNRLPDELIVKMVEVTLKDQGVLVEFVRDDTLVEQPEMRDWNPAPSEAA